MRLYVYSLNIPNSLRMNIIDIPRIILNSILGIFEIFPFKILRIFPMTLENFSELFSIPKNIYNYCYLGSKL